MPQLNLLSIWDFVVYEIVNTQKVYLFILRGTKKRKTSKTKYHQGKKDVVVKVLFERSKGKFRSKDKYHYLINYTFHRYAPGRSTYLNLYMITNNNPGSLIF